MSMNYRLAATHRTHHTGASGAKHSTCWRRPAQQHRTKWINKRDAVWYGVRGTPMKWSWITLMCMHECKCRLCVSSWCTAIRGEGGEGRGGKACGGVATRTGRSHRSERQPVSLWYTFVFFPFIVVSPCKISVTGSIPLSAVCCRASLA